MYVAQFFRVIDPEANPDEYAQACATPYYVGAVHESEFDNGKTLVTILGEKGCRKIGLEGWEPGDATFLGRWAGYQAGVEAWNEAHADDKMEMLEPQYGRTTTDTGRQAAEAIIDANPDIDALIVAGGGGDTLLGAIAGIEAKGLTGKIAVVSTDFLPDLDVKLQTGAMAAESGGHYADPFFAFLMVYNAIKGNYEVSTDGFYDMVFPYMFVDSPESYANYAEYFTGEELPYYADEIKELAGMSYDDLAAACAKLSVEDVVARHAK
jgi:ribose transport system substrate-binding protein